MQKIRVFISSVQKEFARERAALFEYLISDALLGLFFEPFIFEKHPATSKSAVKVYLDCVKQCDIYLGLFGKEYGYEDEEGVSPTEREFDYAATHHKTRLIFISKHKREERHPKQNKLIIKAEKVIVRKDFSSLAGLRAGVYASLISYLRENEYIRTAPFDATLNNKATLEDLDEDKIRKFVDKARKKRGFPFSNESSIDTILTHLDLMEKDKITNASILLFAKKPQRFFISSEVKCAHFHGLEIMKPIPSYQVYKGDVFQLVDQAVDFVLSKIDFSIGVRESSTEIPSSYEIPATAIREAIVNAVAHRDYTSNGSIQVMLFRDRLEIWNPGHLPFGLTVEKLKEPHNSIPVNPLLAEPMYLAGYIERMGTGTGDIIRLCEEADLPEPEFIQEEIFKVIIRRNYLLGYEITPTTKPRKIITLTDTEQVTEQVISLLYCIKESPYSLKEIMEKLQLSHRPYFISNYLNPSLEKGYVAPTQPQSPTSPTQKYKITEKGSLILKQANLVK